MTSWTESHGAECSGTLVDMTEPGIWPTGVPSSSSRSCLRAPEPPTARSSDTSSQGGVPSFWLVDPLTPSVTVLELRDGAYAEIAVVTGEESYDPERPYPVSLVPSELVR